MDEPDDRNTRPGGMNTWRAGCGESRTSGSEGGPQKPTRRKPGRALRSDPYTEVPTDEGKLYLATVEDLASRRIVGFGLSEHHDAELATAMFEWIECWYNPHRRHSYCDGLSPIDYETAAAA